MLKMLCGASQKVRFGFPSIKAIKNAGFTLRFLCFWQYK